MEVRAGSFPLEGPVAFVSSAEQFLFQYINIT